MQWISANGNGGVCTTVFYRLPGNKDCPVITLACSPEVRIETGDGMQQKQRTTPCDKSH
jgi:hypothetical protein